MRSRALVVDEKEIKTLQAMPFAFVGNQIGVRKVHFRTCCLTLLFLHISI